MDVPRHVKGTWLLIKYIDLSCGFNGCQNLTNIASEK